MISLGMAEIKLIEKKSGLTISEIKDISPTSLRKYFEKKNKRAIRFKSEFPVIGRGNVLRDNLVSREELDREIDRILK